MAHRKLALPAHARTRAYHRLEQLLKADPELGRVVRTWVLAAGEPRDDAPPAVAEMPWVKLWGAPASAAWASTLTVLCPLLLTVHVYVEGTDPADLLDLWGRVEGVLLPRDAKARAALGAVVEGFKGVMPQSLDVTATPAGAPEEGRPGWQRLRAQMKIDLYLT